jgi:trehalose 6-phosphate phosphatase
MSTSPPNIDIAACAFFFDLDGTLAPIVDRPENAVVSARAVAMLDAVATASDGAVAIVSGRSLDEIDRMVSPLRLPAAGLHGAVRRRGDGRMAHRNIDRAAVAAMTASAGAALTPGMRLEAKESGLALHFRGNPELADRVLALVNDVIAPHRDGFGIQPGKMVYEVKPIWANKGSAIASFMSEPPFAGRRAVFAGDDATDEHGFAHLNATGGLSIKIGPGPTVAAHRMSDIEDLIAWLEAIHSRPE